VNTAKMHPTAAPTGPPDTQPIPAPDAPKATAPQAADLAVSRNDSSEAIFFAPTAAEAIFEDVDLVAELTRNRGPSVIIQAFTIITL
jgi:hypothetical protein